MKYEICLEINKIFLKEYNEILKFYVIIDKNDEVMIDNIPITVSLESKDNFSGIDFKILPKSVTISAIDHIDRFSSLYEVSFQIPEKIIKRFRINHIKCNISYVVKNNFSLTCETAHNEYNFFIYPNNYGKKLKRCIVKVWVPEEQNYSIVLHRFCVRKEIEKILDFVQNGEKRIEGISYSAFCASFIPQRTAVYFVDLNKI